MRFVLLSLLLAGCASIPALDGRVSDEVAALPYPDLVPLGPVVAEGRALGQGGATGEALSTAVDSRAAALRARAAALRPPVVDDATRDRMARGVDTSALR
ncbi:hypothetical protein [Pelagovum pacificum]|uniref:hypothetical protein n=1 Tax=Pelagovum pacificum TaxID=2588711 RepID=UPI0018CFD69E|nr:hypothetical protein [Pelagovum pacificum]QQA43676.1 hypothetical protein I8N54_03615 [Pelagovum pacificum]